ncbi:MAG: ribosome assembly factor SBDS [Candidatus Bathyarchaeia archaeon]
MSEKFTVARISKGGERFEILVKPDPAFKFKIGEKIVLSQILAIEEIYSDASKGKKASMESLTKCFGTEDPLKVAETILKEGELQLTSDQRRKLIEEKRLGIINFISRNCIDPRTGAPHPPLRIEQALDQLKVPIDPFKDVEEQAKAVIDKMRQILPIRVENVKVEVKVNPEFAAKAYNIIKNHARILEEKWLNDGSWSGVVEMAAGLYGPFIEKMGKATKGTVYAKVQK